MKMIVTGGAGFIGSNFIFHQLEKHPNYDILCVDKLTYAGNLETLAPVMDAPNSTSVALPRAFTWHVSPASRVLLPLN